MKKSKIFLVNTATILLLLFAVNTKGQIYDVDSTATVEVVEDAEEIHSPKKAAIYSTVLPGLGQAYNKKYWKIPLVYVGFGAIGYFIGWNNKYYNVMRIAYGDLTDGDPLNGSHMELVPPSYDLTDPSDYDNFKNALTKQQDYYRRNRDLLIISIAGFYGLNIIDASVDAHLFNFDISEDLTFKWEPTMQNANEHLVYGFNCRFNF